MEGHLTGEEAQRKSKKKIKNQEMDLQMCCTEENLPKCASYNLTIYSFFISSLAVRPRTSDIR